MMVFSFSFLDADDSEKAESYEENPEMVCENCEKKLLKSKIVRHISRKKECKLYYGPRFDEMKKCNSKTKKRKSRQEIGTEQELKRQRESYANNSAKRAKKREYNKKYYQKHRDQKKEYYQDHKEERKEYYQDHKEERKEYYQENREALSKASRERAQAKKNDS